MEKEMDKQLKLKYFNFENEANLCWLNSSIVLVAHNRTLKKIVECSPESQIKKIISAYNEAIATLNNSDCEQRVSKTKKMLSAIQNSTLSYLKQFLKFKPGEPDSAFCALLNLIYQDKSNIKEYLNVSWIWRKQCSNCGVNSKSITCLKPIVTLSKVDAFHPECPSSIYLCTCKSEQEMKLIYKELPPCLIFHFEKGVNAGIDFPVSFSIKEREYQLTGIIILEKSSDQNLNHFITWIRNPFANMWLECNDLDTSFDTFSTVKPKFDLKDVYVAVFEAFDNLDRINNDEISIDQEQDAENSNVELIDLSDEEVDHENIDSHCKTKASEFSKVNKNQETSNFSQNSEASTSKEELVDNENDKSLIIMHSLKMCSDDNPKKSEKLCNINQNVSESDFKFGSKISLKEHEIETKSKNFDCQDKAVNEFIEDKEIKFEEINCQDNKDNEVSLKSLNPSVSTEISTIENLEMYNNEKSKEICKISCQSASVNSVNPPSNIPLDKHGVEAKSNNVSCQNKNVDDSVEASNNVEHTFTDVPVTNKKEKSSSLFDSYNVAKNETSDNVTDKESCSENKSTHNSLISSTSFDNTSDARENKVCDKSKLQANTKQIPWKENYDKFFSLNKKSSEKIKNDQAASTSLSKDELLKFKRVSNDFESYRKKVKMSASKNVKDSDKINVETKPNDEVKPNLSKEEIKNLVDFHVSRGIAAFMDSILKLREKKKTNSS